MKITFENLKNAVRNPYAWPGGYPTLFILADGATLCHKCARSEYSQIARATKHQSDKMWQIVAQEIVYENAEGLYCDHCNEIHEAAYA